MSSSKLVPGDPALVDGIVAEVKSQGTFDQFRRECMADVDTKPAYQNLRQRVETTVAGFLAQQQWRPDMNKNQLREKLRRHIMETGFLETGVERIVDQVVNPKINTVFLSKIEDTSYAYMGLEKPKPSLAECVAAAAAAQPPPTPLHPPPALVPQPPPPPPPPQQPMMDTPAAGPSAAGQNGQSDVPPPGTADTFLPPPLDLDLELEAVSPESDKLNRSSGSEGLSGEDTRMSTGGPATTAAAAAAGELKEPVKNEDAVAAAGKSPSNAIESSIKSAGEQDPELPSFEPMLVGRSVSALSRRSGDNASATDDDDNDDVANASHSDNSKLSAISGLTSQDSVGSEQRSEPGGERPAKMPNESFDSFVDDDVGAEFGDDGAVAAHRPQPAADATATVDDDVAHAKRRPHPSTPLHVEHSSELSQVSSNSRLSIVTTDHERDSPATVSGAGGHAEGSRSRSRSLLGCIAGGRHDDDDDDDNDEAAQMPRFTDNSTNSQNANAAPSVSSSSGAAAAPETDGADADAMQAPARPLQTSFADIQRQTDEIQFEGTRRSSISVDIKAESAAAQPLPPPAPPARLLLSESATIVVAAPPVDLLPPPPLPPLELQPPPPPPPSEYDAPPPPPPPSPPPAPPSTMPSSSNEADLSRPAMGDVKDEQIAPAEVKPQALLEPSPALVASCVSQSSIGSSSAASSSLSSLNLVIADTKSMTPTADDDEDDADAVDAEAVVKTEPCETKAAVDAVPVALSLPPPPAVEHIQPVPDAAEVKTAPKADDFQFEAPTGVDSSGDKSRDATATVVAPKSSSSSSSSSTSRHRSGGDGRHHSSSSSSRSSSGSRRDKERNKDGSRHRSSATSSSSHHRSSGHSKDTTEKRAADGTTVKEAGKDSTKESADKSHHRSSHSHSSSKSRSSSSSSTKHHHSTTHSSHRSQHSSSKDKDRHRTSSSSSTHRSSSSSATKKPNKDVTPSTVAESPRNADAAEGCNPQRPHERPRSNDRDSNDGQPSDPQQTTAASSGQRQPASGGAPANNDNATAAGASTANNDDSATKDTDVVADEPLSPTPAAPAVAAVFAAPSPLKAPLPTATLATTAPADHDAREADFHGFTAAEVRLAAVRLDQRNAAQPTHLLDAADGVCAVMRELMVGEVWLHRSDDGRPPQRLSQRRAQTELASSPSLSSSPSPDGRAKRARTTAAAVVGGGRRPQTPSQSRVSGLRSSGKRQLAAAASEAGGSDLPVADGFRAQRIKIDAHIVRMQLNADDDNEDGQSSLAGSEDVADVDAAVSLSSSSTTASSPDPQAAVVVAAAHVSPTPSELSTKENTFVPKLKKAVSRSLNQHAAAASATSSSSTAGVGGRSSPVVGTSARKSSANVANVPPDAAADHSQPIQSVDQQQPLAAVQKKNSQQRYNSDDLYKPRPAVLGSRSRRRAGLEADM